MQWAGFELCDLEFEDTSADLYRVKAKTSHLAVEIYRVSHVLRSPDAEKSCACRDIHILTLETFGCF